MRDDDLVELAERIALAWARGSGQSEIQKQMAVAPIFTTLREIHDHGYLQDAVFAGIVKLNSVAKLVCCADCERVMRDYSTLARHMKFCVANLGNITIK